MAINPIPVSWCAIGGGALLIAGIWGGWTVRDWQRDSEVLAGMKHSAEQLDTARAAVDRAAQAYEIERQAAAVRTEERTNEIRTIYRDVPVDPGCAVPDGVRRVLDDAVAAANARAAGEPAPGLPAAAEPAGAVGRP